MGTSVAILYTNHRGETARRRIEPQRIWFGKTAWHPAEQWLLDAWDVERQALRTFAMSGVREWAAIPREIEVREG